MKAFFKIKFSEDNHGKIHLVYDLLQKDRDGFYLTLPQKKSVLLLLDMVIRTLNDNDLESLK